MKIKSTVAVLGATVAFSSAVAFQTEAQAQYPSSNNSIVTVFQCVRYGKAFATVAQRGDRRSAPIIVWESYVFGPEYTPQQRCNNVSQRLTSAVAQNGGKMTNLLLTTGIVKGQTVICYINTGEARCNQRNMLFSLKPENAKDPGAALAGLLRFGRSGTGTALHESASGEDEDVAVNMEAAVEEALAAGHESAGGADSSYGSAGVQNTPEVKPSYAPNPQTGASQDGF